MDGILNLDKPAGISSARTVDRVKRLLPRKTKVGHAGTLDPFATGVLVLLIGKATKMCERLMDQPKQYEATIKFGATTATDDLESPEEPWIARDITFRGMGASPLQPSRSDIDEERSAGMPGRGAHATSEVTLEQVRDVLPRFIGAIQQRPPAFSAMKVAGQRAYKLARGGQEVKLEPRTVQIYDIKILDYAWPVLRLRIDCGRGTYIRSIARDLGEALDVGGYLTQLRRTRVGDLTIDRAVTLEQVQTDGVEPHLSALFRQLP